METGPNALEIAALMNIRLRPASQSLPAIGWCIMASRRHRQDTAVYWGLPHVHACSFRLAGCSQRSVQRSLAGNARFLLGSARTAATRRLSAPLRRLDS